MPPLRIEVIKKPNGEIIVKPDPARKKISDPHGNKDFTLDWHYAHGEFIIKFEEDLESPFEDGAFVKESDDRWIRTTIKKHDVQKKYDYEIVEQNPVGEQKASDPGLIIDP
jgi:hypothetical protein